MTKKILVTGGCGFIGSNFIRYMLSEYPEASIINLDYLTYAGNPDNLMDVDTERYEFIFGDVADHSDVQKAFAYKPDYVVHFAAESHVDNSIVDSYEFVRTNVVGTQILLDTARKQGTARFVYVSTDEVYGSLLSGHFYEGMPLSPNSPYASSKAGADLLAQSYYRTYGMDVVVTRCSNNYGPFQHIEKFMPRMITNALQGSSLPIYGDGENIRDWIHVEDHCRAIDYVLQKGQSGEVYNIGANCEVKNVDLAYMIVKELNVPETLIQFVPDRLGHDRRYALNNDKLRRLGWHSRIGFAAGLERTVQWYIANRWWWERNSEAIIRVHHA